MDPKSGHVRDSVYPRSRFLALDDAREKRDVVRLTSIADDGRFVGVAETLRHEN